MNLSKIVQAMYMATIVLAVINMCMIFEVISFGWLFSTAACFYSMVQLVKGDNL